MSALKFECNLLNGTTKAGIIKPDADGYYDLIIGALNFDNSYGAQYCAESAKLLFRAGTSLMRRLSSAYLSSEYGHPKREPGMTDDDYLARIMRIEETRECAHIKDVTIDMDCIKDASGRRVIAFRAKVRPSGPYGPALKDKLENPKENVAFSIRSITDDEYRRGKLIKHLREIITWDYVREPGISIANKYQSPSLESMTLPVAVVKAAIEKASRDSRSGVSTESVDMLRNMLVSLEARNTVTAPSKGLVSQNW